MPFSSILLFLSKDKLLSNVKNEAKIGESLLQRIRQDADSALRDVYKEYREPFLSWSISYFNLDEATASDVFQEVVIAFYKNVVSRKLLTLDASLKTYLFSIGKYILLKRHRDMRKEKTSLLGDFTVLNLKDWDLDTSELEEKSLAEERVISALESLGEKCRELLKMFYFKSASHQEIVNKLGYNSLEVSRSMKRKCIKSLKKIMERSVN